MKMEHEVVGRWIDVLSSLGVDHRYLINRHGKCPFFVEVKIDTGLTTKTAMELSFVTIAEQEMALNSLKICLIGILKSQLMKSEI